MRYVFLGLFAILAFTTAMNHEPEQQGYSQSDVAGVGKLIDRETKPVRHHKVWTATEKRTALQALGWEVAGK